MDDRTWLLDQLEQADLLAAAFAARALAQHGEGEAVSRFHRKTAQSAPAADWRTAAWLWSAGEDYDLLTPDARQAVLQAARRTLPALARATFEETVAYGALYGALRVMAPLLPDIEAARWQKEVREFVFARCTCGGRLAGRPGGEQADPALLLLLPFGLFGPEDLLMVATVQALEADGVPPDGPTAWLAWYYRMKGNRPGRLAELRAALTQQSVWAAAFRLLLTAADGHAVVIRHIPTGYDHPYHRYAPERIPRYPVEGRPVELRATVTGTDGPLWLEWSLNGAPQPPLQAAYQPPHWQEEGYWHVTLGPFPPGAQVRYRFVTEGAETEWFAFTVWAYNAVRRATSVAQGADGRLTIACEDRRGTRLPLVVVEPGPEETLRVRFLPDGEGAPAPEAAAPGSPAPEGTAAPAGAPAPDAPGTSPDAGAPAAPEPPTGEWPLGPYRVRIQPEPFRLTILGPDGRPVLTDHPLGAWEWLEEPGGPVTRTQQTFTLAEGERLYGTGERFDRIDRRGTTVVNTVYNQYKNQGDRTYIPVPFLISSGGYGLWAATDHVGEIDTGATQSDRLRLTFDAPSLDIVLIPGPKPADVLQRFTALVGRPALPPAWAFGPWMSSNNWDSQAEVERQVRLADEHDIPASVLVVEQWSDETTFYLFNDAIYQPRPGGEPFRYEDFTFPDWGRWPDPRAMIERLHQQGIRFLLWQIPVWKHLGGLRHEQHDRDEAFLIERGYVVKNADGTPYRTPEGWFPGSLLLDFTNPDAVRWWLEKRRYLLDEVGVDGFKTDGGEFIWQRDLRFADGSRGDLGRNRYVNQYVGATYRFVQEVTGGDGVTFSRAGYTGAQAFPLHWAGDEASTWQALRATVIAGLNAALAGIAYWGWDLGGFSGDIPTAELYLRGAAMACFCPVMQYHAESKAQFNQDRTPWNIAERTGRPEVLDHYRFFSHLRYNLLPYLYSQAIRSHRTGLPMMRPLFLVHPDDPACAATQDQYYLGDDLLVAPILEPGAHGREVYLPEGRFYDFWTGRLHQGPARIWCPAPWDRIPVFVRAGAALPLNLADSGRLGEGMRHGDAGGLRNLHLYLYPAPGDLQAEHWLTPEQRIAVAGHWDGAALTVSVEAPVEEVTLHAFLPTGDGPLVRRVRGRGPHRLEA